MKKNIELISKDSLRSPISTIVYILLESEAKDLILSLMNEIVSRYKTIVNTSKEDQEATAKLSFTFFTLLTELFQYAKIDNFSPNRIYIVNLLSLLNLMIEKNIFFTLYVLYRNDIQKEFDFFEELFKLLEGFLNQNHLEDSDIVTSVLKFFYAVDPDSKYGNTLAQNVAFFSYNNNTVCKYIDLLELVILYTFEQREVKSSIKSVFRYLSMRTHPTYPLGGLIFGHSIVDSRSRADINTTQRYFKLLEMLFNKALGHGMIDEIFTYLSTKDYGRRLGHLIAAQKGNTNTQEYLRLLTLVFNKALEYGMIDKIFTYLSLPQNSARTFADGKPDVPATIGHCIAQNQDPITMRKYLELLKIVFDKLTDVQKHAAYQFLQLQASNWESSTLKNLLEKSLKLFNPITRENVRLLENLTSQVNPDAASRINLTGVQDTVRVNASPTPLNNMHGIPYT